MARKRFVIDPVRVNLRIDGKTYRASSKRAFDMGISFCDYVSRLLRADAARKKSAAIGIPRVSRSDSRVAFAKQVSDGKWEGAVGATIMERRAAKKARAA